MIEIGHTIASGGRSKYVVVPGENQDGSLRIAIDAPTSDGLTPCFVCEGHP